MQICVMKYAIIAIICGIYDDLDNFLSTFKKIAVPVPRVVL